MPLCFSVLVSLLAGASALFTTSASAFAQSADDADPGGLARATDDKPAENPVVDAQRLDMEALLQELKADPQDSYRPGEAGGIGALLATTGTRTFLHMVAAASVRYATDQSEGSVRPIQTHLDEFQVFVGASILGRLRPELRLNADARRLRVEVAQLDIKMTDWLILRSGLFVVPVGAVNEYFSPEYLSLLPRLGVSEVFTRLIPVKWSGLGIQARGRRQLKGDSSLNYAVFAISEQHLDDDRLIEAGRLPEGGNQSGTAHPLDEHAGGGFAYGARVGFGQGNWLHLGISLFNGTHYLDAHRANLLDADGLVRLGHLEVRTENVLLRHAGHTLWAATGSAGYRITPWFQPAVGVEWFETKTVVAGDGVLAVEALNLRPLPAYGHLILRLAAWQRSRRDTAEHAFGGLIQLAGGF